MKKLLLKTTYLFLFLFFANHINATHIVGGEIFYENVSSGKYKVIASVYRDCRGVSTSTISVLVKSTAGSVNIPMVRTAINYVAVTCDTASSCYPVNTYATGFGVEEHIFEGTVDFNNAPFNSVAWQNACEVSFFFGQCCRNGAVTTGHGSENFVLKGMLNKCLAPNNNSPTFANKMKWVFNLSQPSYYSFGGTDIDGDSLSYKFIAGIMDNNLTPISYGRSNLCGKFYSPTMPLTPFLVDKCGLMKMTPNAGAPQGHYLNSETGEWIFTPTEPNEIGHVVVEVSQWRKDNTGKYQLIGTQMRDHQSMVINSSTNNNPVINGPYTYYAKPGQQLCFNVISKDNPLVPPPPASPPPADTLIMWVSDSLPGGTFIIDSAREKKGTFCWTPSCNDARKQPYRFTVNVRDNHCPVQGFASRVFTVWVSGNGFFHNDRMAICDSIPVVLRPDNDYTGSYLWSTGDTSDSITTDSAGLYWLRTVSPCGDTMTDTITLYHATKPMINLGSDTIICGPINYTLSAQFPNAMYQWSTGETTPTIGIDSTGRYIARAYNACGESIDEIIVSSVDTTNISLNLGPDRTVCDTASIILSTGFPSIPHTWSTGGAGSTITTDTAGLYWVEISVCGLTLRDSILLNFNNTPSVNLGPDRSDSSFTQTLDAGSLGSTYLWSTGDTTQTIIIDSVGTYWVTVTNECGTATDTLNLFMTDIRLLDVISENITIYPNPSSGLFNISFDNIKVSDLELEVVSITGKVVYNNKIHANKGSNYIEPVDISNLAAGIYYVNIKHSGNTYNLRAIIKQ